MGKIHLRFSDSHSPRPTLHRHPLRLRDPVHIGHWLLFRQMEHERPFPDPLPLHLMRGLRNPSLGHQRARAYLRVLPHHLRPLSQRDPADHLAGHQHRGLHEARHRLGHG